MDNNDTGNNRPAWVSTGPEAHHALRLETAELVLQVLREKHHEAFSAALSEVMTGTPISIKRTRARG
jgi:hypothetical protein